MKTPLINRKATETFPAAFDVRFDERFENGRWLASVAVGEVEFGQPLTDNAYESDDYRFHDIFHFSFAAHLGWSPCVRKLLNCKRKSKPLIDEVEDGGRAAVVEEAISLLAFTYARENDWYVNKTEVQPELLQTIRRLTQGLEVADAMDSDWQNAILEGYKIFRLLKINRGGTVKVCVADKKLTYESACKK